MTPEARRLYVHIDVHDLEVTGTHCWISGVELSDDRIQVEDLSSP